MVGISEDLEKTQCSAVQVMDGGSGGISELDINVLLVSPTGQTLLAEYKQPRGQLRLTAPLTGDYKLCLSNKFSFLSSKTVNLEVLVGPEDGQDDDLAGKVLHSKSVDSSE